VLISCFFLWYVQLGLGSASAARAGARAPRHCRSAQSGSHEPAGLSVLIHCHERVHMSSPWGKARAAAQGKLSAALIPPRHSRCWDASRCTHSRCTYSLAHPSDARSVHSITAHSSAPSLIIHCLLIGLSLHN